MNKQDVKLLGIVLFLALSGIFLLSLRKQEGPKKAVVYYENTKVLEIDLEKKEPATYEVEGYNGKVQIVTEYGKVKVESENSPLHLCSKQGYIHSSYESIVCLPNKIVVTIEANDSLDAIAK